MVVQVQTEVPLESARQKQKMESKKYVVVKNHVREITNKNSGSSASEESLKDVENSEKSSKFKRAKKPQSSSSEDDNVDINVISKSDLEELKTVYKKCKAVLMNIESKYGHLLDLDSENELSRTKRKHDVNSDELDECNCTLNRKIVFNEDGQQVLEEGFNPENHICPKKLKCYDRHYGEKYQSVQIEHENLTNNLPDSIQELTELLKNPSIKSNVRRDIIEKIKNIRQEHLNMIRFDKDAIIEKLKSNPDEIMDFKGTNISSLAGYPTKKIVD